MTASLRTQASSAVLVDSREADALAAYLTRLLRYDRRAAVRLVADGTVLGCFGAPPFDVIAVRSIRLAGEAVLDITVSAGELLDSLAVGVGGAGLSAPSVPAPSVPVASVPLLSARTFSESSPDTPGELVSGELVSGELVLPAAVAPQPWSGVLPPRHGWRPLATMAPGEAFRQADDAVAEFRRRAAALPEETGRARLDRIAEEVWCRSLTGGIPARAVHAARALGFVGPDTAASVHGTGPWLQLRTPFGVIAVRRPDAPDIRLVGPRARF